MEMRERPTLAVIADPRTDEALRSSAAAIAGGLGVPTEDEADPAEVDLAVAVTPLRVELRALRGDPMLIGGHAVAPEFEKLDTTSPMGRSLRQPLLKAVGIKKGERYRPRVLDGTAGFGEDAWLLAAAGCEVTAIERVPVMAVLLENAVARATAHAPATAGRIRVVHADAAVMLERASRPGEDRPDVVFLDPMFPGAAERKALERKAMRVLRWLAGSDSDADALLGPALAAAGRRVVVKRPNKAPPLDGREPTVVHRGKGVRYDVYATA